MVEKDASVNSLTYELALHELETIITSLEEGPTELEQSVKLYERGKILVQHCQRLLDEAELKIHQLEEDGTNKPIKE